MMDKATGRSTEYETDSDEVISFSEGCYGHIDFLFLYREVKFAFIQQFDGALTVLNGLVLIENCTKKSRALCCLQSEEISRPLITAVDPHPKLWIINVPYN